MTLSLEQFQQWNEGLSSATRALNTEHFPTALINAIRNILYADSMMVCLERRNQAPVLLCEYGVPSDIHELTVNRYLSKIYMLDPFYMAVESGLEEGFYHISDMAPDDFFESEYYKVYYINSGTKEDCYFMINIDDNTKISLCIYHNSPTHSYSQQELAQARSAFSVIKELALMAWGNNPSSDEQGDNALHQKLQTVFNEFGSSVLTDRERDVILLILRGHSSKSAAKVLDIAPGTVQEHRKNTYRKLNISSQSELFSVFLDAISGSVS